jgi:phosphatidylinositol alpha-1,6-mannosyltransferase
MPLAGRNICLGAALLGAGHGGIARVGRLTALSLCESGANPKLLSLLDDKALAVGDVNVWRASGSKMTFALKCLSQVVSGANLIYDSVGLARAHLNLPIVGRPYAVWMHGIEVWNNLTPHKKNVLKGASLRLVNSEFTLRRYREEHGELVNATVCWLATEQDNPPEVFPDYSGPPTAMILGRVDGLDSYKGHAELVAAWPRVVSAVPGAVLLIVGSGPGLPALKRLVARSEVAGQIEIAGFVAESDMPSFWRRAHLLAMPSRKEGFGLVYIEAMRNGLPVIASIHDAAPEVNIHGRTGYNVDLDKGDDLTSRLVELLRSPDLCRELGRASLERWSNHFCFSAFRRRITPIIEEFSRGT